jgi:hypothetical protein
MLESTEFGSGLRGLRRVIRVVRRKISRGKGRERERGAGALKGRPRQGSKRAGGSVRGARGGSSFQ